VQRRTTHEREKDNTAHAKRGVVGETTVGLLKKPRPYERDMRENNKPSVQN
jgi:hypothetical protein